MITHVTQSPRFDFSYAGRYAYVEFAEAEFVDAALAMDNSLFRGRLIKVCLRLLPAALLPDGALLGHAKAD